MLEDVKKEQVDCLAIGGDVVTGPMSSETLELLQSLDLETHFILGNAETDILDYLKTGKSNGLSERANVLAQRTAKILTPEQQEFIATWSKTITLEVADIGKVLFCHATPTSDTFIFTNRTPEEKLIPIFDEVDASTVICGHTHMQFDRTIGNTRVVNAGSVGMPFGKTGAYWLLLDKTVQLKQKDYDLVRAAERIRQTNYSGAEDFAKNNILKVTSEEEAHKMLAKMEAAQSRS